ncbi:hypothetical protein [Cupriavidus sp. a3]
MSDFAPELRREAVELRIAGMLDAAYPRYACTRARLAARRNRYGRPRF